MPGFLTPKWKDTRNLQGEASREGEELGLDGVVAERRKG